MLIRKACVALQRVRYRNLAASLTPPLRELLLKIKRPQGELAAFSFLKWWLLNFVQSQSEARFLAVRGGAMHRSGFCGLVESGTEFLISRGRFGLLSSSSQVSVFFP